MLEILQFYVSGFWVWLGLTFGIALIGGMFAKMVIDVIAEIRGEPTFDPLAVCRWSHTFSNPSNKDTP